MIRSRSASFARFPAGVALLAATLASTAHAAPSLRVQVVQRGDFVLAGNTLGHDCGAGVPAPVIGTVGTCGTGTVADTSPDVYWRSDAPAAGQATADTSIAATSARGTTMLALPPGATVTHAYLYWAGRRAAGPDTSVQLERPGVSTTTVTAVGTYYDMPSYVGVADVTAHVQALGAGAYRVSDVDTDSIVDLNNATLFVGYWMVVLYALPSAPTRHFAVYEGLDMVTAGSPALIGWSGFLVPPAFGSARVGVVGLDGDDTLNGDALAVDSVALSDAQNPGSNFWNGTRSFLGAPTSVAGDLPQLTGTARSMSGLDLDVVDVTATLAAGQTTATLAATSTSDTFHLATVVAAIPTWTHDLSASTKSVLDLNGGDVLTGDQLEYTIVATNTGDDGASGVVLTDPLPDDVDFVSGSLAITAGVGIGVATDDAGDDACEYVAGTRTVRCRLGTGADATSGGVLGVGETTTLQFRVTVGAGALGTIANQGTLSASGVSGGPNVVTATDGNGAGEGAPSTDVFAHGCSSDADCASPTPFCATSVSPKICIACRSDADCHGAAPTCNGTTNSCVCNPAGAEVCNGRDDDCNGQVDDGDPGAGVACATGRPGVCAAGLTACSAGAIVCVPSIAQGTMPDTNCDAVDQDCDGTSDEDYVPQTTTCGLGPCQRTGATSCVAGAVEDSCVAGAPGASDATCDGIDDDCDGSTDEEGACGSGDAGMDAMVADAGDDASVPDAGGDASDVPTPTEDAGCSCRVAGGAPRDTGAPGGAMLAAAVVAWLASRRRACSRDQGSSSRGVVASRPANAG